jgi:hypothetical protein
LGRILLHNVPNPTHRISVTLRGTCKNVTGNKTKMNKFILWVIRTTGIVAALWFFFWAIPYEIIVWNKTPDTLNLIYMTISCVVATTPNFTKSHTPKQKTQQPKKHAKIKTKQQHHEKLHNLEQQLLEANPTERKKILEKINSL